MTEPTATPAALDPSAMTPAQATAEITQTWENPEHDCFHAGRPGYAAAKRWCASMDKTRRRGRTLRWRLPLGSATRAASRSR